ncbi:MULTISPECIES: WXG100 family type VII secretion target [unclassified Streptomyces]|uniref:WXG100 family type VII secretion target n=1 Tax=unclassified Streptomyces TaxID=2593676 RepID=UPI000F5B8E85|nr:MULTISPECIES: hypothetical protein [unclassified Streptomyces]RPK56707.1 hypothetical protein EES42_40375 [Streptomyces sp. ADI95-17]WSC29921.1 hypothetical protein OG902_26325 [Streptomyces sp. NBC_01768]WSP48779.1 hypothetical protein OG348_24560 [Streptomyces sp. NBC_01243]WSX01781.1 hypothetical protein OG355_15835 [Streptomyces sp. NBC_00987]
MGYARNRKTTPFEEMSHEDMLSWLDKANSGAVQGAADKLRHAAGEIHKIAEDLKVRPQWVEWKGDGADAFRTWSADLANSTLGLGDYSEVASKWLTEASSAIATAKASIPRTDASAKANLDAARAAHNDPDASAVAKKSAETLMAKQESDRQDAVAEMRRLAQSYAFSSFQMDGLKRPTFPTPPQGVLPDAEVQRDASRRGIARAGAGGGGEGDVLGGTTVHGQGFDPSVREAASSAGVTVSPPSVGSHVPRPVGMEIDGATALPEAPSVPTATPPGQPSPGRPDLGLPSTTVPLPPTFGGRPAMPPGPSGAGEPIGVPRLPNAGPGRLNPVAVGRPPGGDGIIGGRPVPPTSGHSTGGIPRGTVIGGEGTQGRAPMGRVPGMGGMGARTGMGTGAGQGGVNGGRRLAGETGGIVGGRPQQSGLTGTRPFTPGGSGLARAATPAQGGHGTRRGESGERPDYLTEDEETWHTGDRRVVPPVID